MISSILAVFKTIGEIIGLLKAAYKLWQEGQEASRRKEFNDGVRDGDTKKVEDAFGSDKAGKPDDIGDIEWNDEKPK